jgi:hypothetical protein
LLREIESLKTGDEAALWALRRLTAVVLAAIRRRLCTAIANATFDGTYPKSLFCFL